MRVGIDIGSVAVCSWSLVPTSPADLAAKLRACGVSRVQLALDPLREGGAWAVGRVREALGSVVVQSGMMSTRGEDYVTLETIRATGGVRSDEHWSANLAAARENAQIARDMGVTLVTLHAGFLPEDFRDPLRRVMMDRVATLARVFGERGVMLGLETGQEHAHALAAMLREWNEPNLGVNFDPANMILYGMGEPVAGLRTLLPWVRQVHIKDALPAAVPGQWGSEVVVGTGFVAWREFLDVLASAEREIPCVMEREAGETRVADIRAGLDYVTRVACDMKGAV